VTKNLEHAKGPVVAVSDYVRLVAEQISPFIPSTFTALGTDGFGRSETREDLRNFFEIDKHYIVLAALNTLAKEGNIQLEEVGKAIKKYGIDPEKPNPKNV
jgi:pyruvate dehydrogenase E1 component